MARGLAGAALFAVPVAVAALIGFGTGFSGVTGGLSSFTNGPDAVPAAAPTGPRKLNHAVVALASKQAGSDRGATTGNGGGGASNVESTGSVTDTGGGSDAGSGGSGGGSDTAQVPTVSTPRAPQVTLPGSGSGGAVGGATDSLNGTVNDVVGGVNNTLDGLLGK